MTQQGANARKPTLNEWYRTLHESVFAQLDYYNGCRWPEKPRHHRKVKTPERVSDERSTFNSK